MILLQYPMLLNHVGVVNRNEDEAARFYRDLLGLDLTREVTVSSDLSGQLFSYSQDVKMLVFEKGGIKVEVFICPGGSQPSPNIRHIGFLLDDFPSFVDRAQHFGIDLITGKSGEKTVYFVKDYSGNLIEVKQK